MSRPVQPVGTYGDISVRKVGTKYAATTRYREDDGSYVRIQATGASGTKAKNALKARIAERVAKSGDSDLDGSTLLAELARYWLEEARLIGRQSPQTLDAYEHSLTKVVLPALGQLRLRELTVGRVDRFLKANAAEAPSRARTARVVLALVLDLAVRHDALPKNPVRGAGQLPRSRREVLALDQAKLARLRDALAMWRTGENVHGPKPDGQLADVIETILGTSARIGEALAIRKCDVDMTVSPPEVTISGTLVHRRGLRPVPAAAYQALEGLAHHRRAQLHS